jgi:hypothetical protein
MTILAKPVSEGYVITPVASAVTDHPPTEISGQRWLLVLSGVAVCNFEGQTTNDWTRDTILIQPDINGALEDAIASHNIPRPHLQPPTTAVPGFQVNQAKGAPFATLNSIFDTPGSLNDGFAVDSWQMSHHFAHNAQHDAYIDPIVDIIDGLTVDAAVRNSDAELYRIGYHITLIGLIVFWVKEPSDKP